MACGKCAGACGRVIYTWHLPKKCAHWPLDNAHSLILALFSGKKELIYQNSLEHNGRIFCCLSGYSHCMGSQTGSTFLLALLGNFLCGSTQNGVFVMEAFLLYKRNMEYNSCNPISLTALFTHPFFEVIVHDSLSLGCFPIVYFCSKDAGKSHKDVFSHPEFMSSVAAKHRK